MEDCLCCFPPFTIGRTMKSIIVQRLSLLIILLSVVQCDDVQCDLCKRIQEYFVEFKGESLDEIRQKLPSMIKHFHPDDVPFLTNLTHYNIRKLYLDANYPSSGMTPTTTCADMGYCNDEFMFKPTTFTTVNLMSKWEMFTDLLSVRDRTIIVLHDTEEPTLNETLTVLRRRNISVTYVIDVDGQIYQLASEYRRSFQSGVGIWKGDGCLSTDLNGRSISIETVNSGEEPFAPEQVRSIHNLISYLRMKWHIAPQNVIAHHENAPDYKFDISGYFSWKALSDDLQLWNAALWHTKLTPSEQKEIVLSETIQNTTLLTSVQQMLYDYGYGTLVVGSAYNKSTSAVTTAMVVQSFNRKYVPELFIKETIIKKKQVQIPSNQQVYRITLERLTYVTQHSQPMDCIYGDTEREGNGKPFSEIFYSSLLNYIFPIFSYFF